MSTMKFVSRFVLWLGLPFVTLAAYKVFVLENAAVDPKDLLTALVAWIAIYYCSIQLIRTVSVWVSSYPEHLDGFAAQLWDTRRSRRRFAMQMLSLACGVRFGRLYYISRGRHERACNEWRRWWTQNHDRLSWDPVLEVYVESHDSSEEAAQ